MAQGRWELAVSGGGGALNTRSDTTFSPVVSLSLLAHIDEHVSVEGGFDLFWRRLVSGPEAQSVFWDDYAGAEISGLFHFRPSREERRWIPFVAAGIGATSTDFTEIAAHRYYRLGAGLSCHFNERYGIRFELRDEIIEGLGADLGDSKAHLPSLRAGFVLRFDGRASVPDIKGALSQRG
jgi:hypothetical protein